MEPVNFQHSNKTLSPPVRAAEKYSDNVDDVESLHVWTDGEQCVSCWKMSWKERLLALWKGRVWCAVLSGETQPPIFLIVQGEYLSE